MCSVNKKCPGCQFDRLLFQLPNNQPSVMELTEVQFPYGYHIWCSNYLIIMVETVEEKKISKLLLILHQWNYFKASFLYRAGEPLYHEIWPKPMATVIVQFAIRHSYEKTAMQRVLIIPDQWVWLSQIGNFDNKSTQVGNCQRDSHPDPSHVQHT